MKTIFAVSPDYLEVMYQEAIKYDFVLQGYGNIAMALQGLLQVNVSEILGFVVLVDNISNLKHDLYNLFFALDLIESPKKLLLVSRGQNPFNVEELKNDYPHVNFHQLFGLEVITDEVINREIFGSILLDNYEPYVLEKKEVIVTRPEVVNLLKYNPVIPSYVTNCLNEVLVLNTVDMTIEADEVLRTYDRDKSKLAIFRENYIYAICGLDINEDKLLSAIKEERGNQSMYCIYYALYRLIKETHGKNTE